MNRQQYELTKYKATISRADKKTAAFDPGRALRPCGQTAMHTEQDMEQVLTEAQAEKILEAIKTEAIQDEIAYEMARPRISPELDLFDLQNGLGW